jgi:hypothetical protein
VRPGDDGCDDPEDILMNQFAGCVQDLRRHHGSI